MYILIFFFIWHFKGVSCWIQWRKLASSFTNFIYVQCSYGLLKPLTFALAFVNNFVVVVVVFIAFGPISFVVNLWSDWSLQACCFSLTKFKFLRLLSIPWFWVYRGVLFKLFIHSVKVWTHRQRDCASVEIIFVALKICYKLKLLL